MTDPFDYDINQPIQDLPARNRALAELRRRDPVHWDERYDLWLVTKHADVREVARHPELYSSSLKGPWHPHEAHVTMQAMDGPEHVRNRNIVSRGFTPRMVAGLAERAQVYMDAAIDAVAGRERFDFVEELAAPLPIRVIADMVGVEAADVASFRRWSDCMMAASGAEEGSPAREAATRAGIELRAYLGEAIAKRRVEPGDDILSTLIEAERDGSLGLEHKLSDDELFDYAMQLLVAGNETTRHTISRGMRALLERPDQLARLRAEPELLGSAVEEVLRHTAVVRALRRTLTRDAELRGRKLRAGDSVVMLYASANRDEEVFDAPDELRLDRSPNEQLSFGLGPHYCLGANLARMEIGVALATIARRLPDLELDPDAETTWVGGVLVDGPETMPVRRRAG